MQKTTILLILLCFTTSTIFGQQIIQNTQPSYGSYANKIIVTSDSTYTVFVDTYNEYSHATFFNDKHKIIKTIEKSKTNEGRYSTSTYSKNGIALLAAEYDYCDVRDNGYLILQDTQCIEKRGFGFRNMYIDKALNLYQYDYSTSKIITYPYDNENAKFTFDGIGRIANFVALSNDTVLIGNTQGLFYTAYSNGIIQIAPTDLFDTPINADAAINDFSSDYFCIKSTGAIYNKKSLSKIGTLNKPVNSSFDRLCYVDGYIYHGNKTATLWDKYGIDTSGKLYFMSKIGQNFVDKKMFLVDFISFKGKIVAVADAFNGFNTNTNQGSGQNDFVIVLDSINQEIKPINEVDFTLPIQANPKYDNKCGGYKFNNLAITLVNNGEDTLKRLLLKGGTFGYNPFFCIPPQVQQWELKDISIAPQSTQTIEVKNICIRSFERSKDSIITFCLIAALPNGSHDSDLTNNISCFSFKSYDKEIATNDVLLADYQATVRFYENDVLVKIDVPFQHATLKLYDLSGRLVQQQDIANAVQNIDVAAFPAGMYIANLVIDRVGYLNKKIVLIK